MQAILNIVANKNIGGSMDEQKSFWEKVMEIGKVVIPGAMMAATIFVPGAPQVVKILSEIPSLIAAAQGLFTSGAAKKEFVMEAITSAATIAASVSTGGQKETMEKIVKLADPLTEAIVASVKTYDDLSIDTAQVAMTKMIEATAKVAEEFEWMKATAAA